MKIFTPLDTLDQTLRYWWLVALLTVWGGGIAWLFHETRPPLYEAQAVFTVGIDFSQTGGLTQYEEDLSVGAAGGVMVSTAVIERTLARAQSQGIPIDLATFSGQAHLERKHERWIMIVRNPDPATAAALADTWAGEALASLEDARQHALLARSLQRHLDGLETCLMAASSLQKDQGLCSQRTLEQIRLEMQSANQALQSELIASQGIMPALVFDLPVSAAVPSDPVRYGTNTLVLTGGLIGFITGAILVNLQLLERLSRARRRA